MAKKNKIKKGAAPQEVGVDAGVPKKSGVTRIFVIAGFVMAFVFMASTLLLVVGMLPTAIAFLVDRGAKKTKALSVGALNLAGCLTFLLELWVQDNSISGALNIVSEPMNIVVMYFAAAVGYMVDWSMSGIVANILYQRGQARKKAIFKYQESLVDRWGVGVTGKKILDD